MFDWLVINKHLVTLRDNQDYINWSKIMKLHYITLLLASLGFASQVQAQTCYNVAKSTPTARFSITDTTVVDKQTGLMWAKCSLGQTGKDCTGSVTKQNWSSAQSAVTAKNASAAGYLGHKDWRLPNIKELTSIFEAACTQPAINIDVFPNTPTNTYWSATPFSRKNDDRYIWTINFNYGIAGATDRTYNRTIRLVRDMDIFINKIAGDDLINTSEDDQDIKVTGTSTLANKTPITLSLNGKTYHAQVLFGRWSASIAKADIQALAENTELSLTASASIGADTFEYEKKFTRDTAHPTASVTPFASRDTTPKITGTVNDHNARVIVNINGTNYNATNNQDGTWTLKDNAVAALTTTSDGDKNFEVTVTAIDVAGNLSDTTATGAKVSISIDVTPPTTQIASIDSITDDTLNARIPGSNNDFATSDNNGLIIKATLSNALETGVGNPLDNGEKVQYSNDNGSNWVDVPSSSIAGTVITHTDAALTASKTIQFRVLDSVGNIGTATTKAITIDTEKPTVTVISFSTTQTSPALNGKFSDNRAGTTIKVNVNSKDYDANTTNGKWVLSANRINPALSVGSHTLSITATDAVGNTQTVTGELVITANAISIDSMQADNTSPLNTSFKAEKLNGVIINATLDKALKTGESVKYSNDGTNWHNATVNTKAITYTDNSINKNTLVRFKIIKSDGTAVAQAQQLVMLKRLNDTGRTKQDQNTTCSSSTFQDCHFGRDKTVTAGDKIGKGKAGFDFTKLDNQGKDLADTATAWVCVRDNVTGLIWKKQTDGGAQGVPYADTVNIINTANEDVVCGKSNWRMPTILELQSIVDYEDTTQSLDKNYFGDVKVTGDYSTKNGYYWSSSLNGNNRYRLCMKRSGNYACGLSNHSSISPTNKSFVRLVSPK